MRGADHPGSALPAVSRCSRMRYSVMSFEDNSDTSKKLNERGEIAKDRVESAVYDADGRDKPANVTKKVH